MAQRCVQLRSKARIWLKYPDIVLVLYIKTKIEDSCGQLVRLDGVSLPKISV